MGICVPNTCCNDYERVITCQNFHFIKDEDYSFTKEKIILKNGKSVDNALLLLSKKYFKKINEIKQNPMDFILQSKSHNLFDAFIKLSSSNPFFFAENNKFDVISYLMECKEQTSVIEKEIKLKSIINNGNINNICLMTYFIISNDVEENIWYFLEENEDDIDKIFSDNYIYLMIICLPINNDKIVVYFILYNI